MIVAIVVVGILLYLAFHVGAGHTHYRYQRSHGFSPNFCWSAARGPYASVRLPGGFRVGHRL